MGATLSADSGIASAGGKSHRTKMPAVVRSRQSAVSATGRLRVVGPPALFRTFAEGAGILNTSRFSGLGLVGSTLLLLLMGNIGGGIACRCAMWHENALSHSPRQV